MPIGVQDYDTLVELLADEFARVFPDYGPTDPQNMIQLMGATIMELRGKRAYRDPSFAQNMPRCGGF